MKTAAPQRTERPLAEAATLMFHLVRDHDHTTSTDPGARTLPVLEVIHENLHAVAEAAALRTLLSA